MLRSLVPALVGAILGFIAGLLLGIYIVSGGENTLGLAAIAIGATVGTPLLVWYLQDSSERRKEAISIRQRNEDKFGLHALDLNSHVFNPSISATLEFPLERYPAEVSSGLGLLVRTTGPQTFGIAGLANWEYGLEHMLANLALRGAWEDVTAKVAAYMDLKREAANAHRQRFSELVRADYGPDMRISQNIIETPPTCDVESLVWLALGRRGSLSRRDFFIPGGPVQAGVPDAPTLISVWNSVHPQWKEPRRG